MEEMGERRRYEEMKSTNKILIENQKGRDRLALVRG
jgi:hypothetical protein